MARLDNYSAKKSLYYHNNHVDYMLQTFQELEPKCMQNFSSLTAIQVVITLQVIVG